MNKRLAGLLVLTLVVIGAGAGLLKYYQSHQRLGPPGVKTRPIPGSANLEVLLPATVLDYTSKDLQEPEIVTNTLPKDTSFGQRLYTSPDGFQVQMNVVLMGADRTSLHKPQFCLEGQGWKIDQAASTTMTIQMDRPVPYQLPVARLIASMNANVNGQTETARGVCLYYYVTDGALSASSTGFQRMWLMAKQMLRTGVLQRWAYVMCFSACPPGQESATVDRMKKFIAAAAPQFQLTPAPEETRVSSKE